MSLDPYAPIEKRSLFTTDSMKSRAFTVRVADPTIPAGWQEVGVVSDDYLLVPNREVRDMAREIAERSGFAFTEERVTFDGKRFSYALAAKPDRTGNPLVEVRVGDFAGIGLLFENSYDGTRKLSASLFAYRLACRNGMLARDLFRTVSFKHYRHNSEWETDVQKALTMLRHAPRGLEQFAAASRELSSMRLTATRLREIRKRVLPKLPVTLWGKSIDRLLHHEQLDGFGLLNAVTNLTWHDERPSAATLTHNEYATNQLVEYALKNAATSRN